MSTVLYDFYMADGNESLYGREAASPGEQIRLLLEERHWTQEDLATITGRSRQQIIDLVMGRRGITTDMALALASAFSTSPSFWLNLDTAFRLASTPADQNNIGSRAKLFTVAPIREMQKRGWISSSKDLSDVERSVLRFFGADSLDNIPEFSVATRRSGEEGELSPPQRAWCFRARQLASALCVNGFDPAQIPSLKKRLRQLAAFAGNIEKVPETLAKYGIRFLVIEPLSGSRMDGVAFWIDEKSPVIAISLRYDRIDWFWFTLMHELAHIEHGDAISIDTDLVSESESPPLVKSEMELRADSNAAASLVPPEELKSFMRRIGPTYSEQKIVQFAHRIKMHPAVIAGQLQHGGEMGYGAVRDLFVKIKDRIINTALTDGWGHRIAPGVN